MKYIWSLPNTILSWLLMKLVRDRNIIARVNNLTIISGGWIGSVTLGKYAISSPTNKEHELKHVKISRLLGWGYLIHIYYLIYSIVLICLHNNYITSINFLGAILFFVFWFWFNEYLTSLSRCIFCDN